MTETMRAITVSEAGDADVLQVTTLPRPQPGADEVLIKVEAAGINRADIFQRRGIYPPPPDASPIIGMEVAGTVVAVGENVRYPKVGEQVCALVAGGGYAQYCVAFAQLCLPVPKGLTIIEAAVLPEAFFTVWINVFERGHLKPGESVLIQGGSSGIGVVAIQLAKALGSTVYATAGSAEKCTACEKLGAKKAINYKTEDFVAVIKQITNNRGVDVILDIVGGDYVDREISILAEDGRLTIIGTMGGKEVTFNIRDVISRRLTLTGSSLRLGSTADKARVAPILKEKVWPLLEEGKIKTVIYKSFPFEDVADAHRLMESSEHIGKIVLTMEG